MERYQLEEYVNVICSMSKESLVKERRELYELINGDIFFALKEWPEGCFG